MVVDLLLVPDEVFGHVAQDMRGQRQNAHLWEDQKPGVVCHYPPFIFIVLNRVFVLIKPLYPSIISYGCI